MKKQVEDFIEHTKEGLIKCKGCKTTFDSVKELERHLIESGNII